MDTVFPPQPRGYQKSLQVLGDRTNVDAGQVKIKGKPPPQIDSHIWRFHAQKIGNNNQVGGVDQAAQDRKCTPRRNVTDKAVDDEVKDRSQSVQGPRKERKAFTSTLTARSKAMACGVNNKPKDQIVDFDTADVNNELAVVEYVDELYKFYKHDEDNSRVGDYLDKQPEVNSKMRSILVDWLIEVHSMFGLTPETLYLTVNITDRFLSRRTVTRRELQLVGISSMVIASKYEEVWAPKVQDFEKLSSNYTCDQIREMEKAILEELGWYLTVPTPYVFLARYIKASISPDDEMRHMVFFLSELGVLDYQTTIRYSPSMIAAAAVYAACCTLNKKTFWSETLKHHTGYSEEQLRDCAEVLVGFHSKAAESDLKAVYQKYLEPDYGAVAGLPHATTFQSSS